MLTPQAPFGSLVTAPISVISDPLWRAEQLRRTARRFRVPARTATVLWWYSASSVLLGPTATGFVSGGPVPATDSLVMRPDGQLVDARASTFVARDDAPSLVGELVSACVTALGEPSRALWAIASDSLANRVLWAGGTPSDAEALAADERFPVPRFVEVGGQRVVRRSSCCLVYESPGEQKCVSCPRQRPDDRLRRLRAAFGQVS
jgi:FhuF 2Fe-2S C-terminal domain